MGPLTDSGNPLGSDDSMLATTCGVCSTIPWMTDFAVCPSSSSTPYRLPISTQCLGRISFILQCALVVRTAMANLTLCAESWFGPSPMTGHADIIHFFVWLHWELPLAVDQALVAAGLKAKPGSWTLSTVRHRVAVLSTAHRLKQLPNPCEQPAVRTVLSRAGRAAVKRGERPRKKTAITLIELEAMLATCDETLEGLRDRALLCFGFASGGRRRSEVAAADCSGCFWWSRCPVCPGSQVYL